MEYLDPRVSRCCTYVHKGLAKVVNTLSNSTKPTGKMAFALALVTAFSFTAMAQTAAKRMSNGDTKQFVQASQSKSIEFVENKGQWPGNILYRADVPGGQMQVTPEGMLIGAYSPKSIDAIAKYNMDVEMMEMARRNGKLGHHNQPVAPKLEGHGWKMVFEGGSMANAKTISRSGESKDVSNFFVGDVSTHATNVHSYNELSYTNVYPGINVKYYTSKEGALENDIIVTPGADAKQIKMKFDGIDQLKMAANGGIILPTTVGNINIPSPVCYLVGADGNKTEIKVKYQLLGRNTITFEIPDYDKTQTLVIDPIVMRWATWISSTSSLDSHCHGIDIDASGNIYVVGKYGTGLITVGAFQTTFNAGGNDIMFISEYQEPATPGGSGTRVWQTYLGGTSQTNPYAVNVGLDGNVYIIGLTNDNLAKTYGTGAPTSSWTQRTAVGGIGFGTQTFVAKVAANGAWAQVRELGGVSQDLAPTLFDLRLVPTTGNNFDIEAVGTVYENTSNVADGDVPVAVYPNGTTASAVSQLNGYALRITSDLNTLVWTKQYATDGGTNEFLISCLDNSGNILIGGVTTGVNNVNYNNPSTQTTSSGSQDGWLMSIKASNGAANWSRFFNSASFAGTTILCMETNPTKTNIIIGGMTTGLASGNISATAYQPTYPGGGEDFYVASLPVSGASTNWGTYFGGTGSNTSDNMMGLNVDQNGDVYVLGYTNSKDIPVVAAQKPLQNANYDPFDYDAIFFKLSGSNGSSLLYSTYLGGSSEELDPAGERGIKFNNCRIYLAITSASNDFPLTSGTLDSTMLLTNGYHLPLILSLANPPDLSGNQITGGGNQTLTCGSIPATITASTAGYVIPPVIRNGVRQTNGTNGAYPNGLPTVSSVQWQVSYDNGTTWANIPGATGNNLTFSTPVVFVGTVEYRRIINGDACNRSSDSLAVAIIHFNPTPTAPSATTNSPVCTGQQLTLTGSSSDPGAIRYVWTRPSARRDTVNPDVIASAQTTDGGQWNVYTINAAGCPSVSTNFNVVVNTSASTPTASSNSPVCTGGTLNLSVTGSNGATFQWTGPNGFTSTSSTPSITNVTSANAGDYHVTQSFNGSCTSAPATVHVVIDTIAKPTVSASPNPACIGGTLTLTATGISGATFTWSYPDGGGTTTTNNTVTRSNVTSQMGGSYCVYQTSGQCVSQPACVSVATQSFVPGISVSPKTVGPYCPNTIVTLTGTQAVSYVWSTGATTPSIHVTANGVVIYTVTATNASGCVGTAQYVLVGMDTSAPYVLCKNINISLDSTGHASIQPTDVILSSGDNCGIASRTVTPSTFDCRNVGVNEVTVTVTDGAGNSSSCVAAVTVTGNPAPHAVCRNATVTLDASGHASVTAAQIDGGSSSACGNITITATPTNFTCANIGPNQVKLIVTDVNGNSDSCVATVTVKDATPPTAVCKNITITLDATGHATITAADIDGGSTDNCGIASLVASQTSFDCSNIGQNNVTLTVTDNAGRTSTCTAVVTVAGSINPVANCKNATVYLDASGHATISTGDIDNGSSATCGTPTLSLSQSSFTCANVGRNNVTLTVTDFAGHTATCTAVVTVLDTIKPVAICKNITVNLGMTGTVSITASQINNGSYDNCSVTLSASKTLFGCGDLGANNVVLTATDPSGNTSTCTAVVTVNDPFNPVAVCKPATIYLDANGHATLAPADVDGGSHDMCGIVTRTVSQTSFSCADRGTHQVTLTVTDAAGHTASCTASVTVVDNTPPTVHCQAVNLVLDASGHATLDPTQVNNGSTDNCGIASMELSQTIFDCSNLGENSVTLTVTDVAGNSSTCTSTVTVTQTITPPFFTSTPPSNPVAVGQNFTYNITATDPNGFALVIGSTNLPSWLTLVDNGNGTATLSGTPFAANVGANTVTLTLSDGHVYCSGPVIQTFIINVYQSNLAVSIQGVNSCGQDANGAATAIVSGGTAPFTYAWASTGAGATDVSTQTGTSLTGLAPGTYSVTVTDFYGVTGSATIVISATNPNIQVTADTSICIGASVQLLATGGDLYSWSPATGLNDANIANPIATPTVTTTYTVTGYVHTGNLVTNGDFTAGNTGFTSGYGYVSPQANAASSGGNTGLYPEGLYAVDVNAHIYHPNFFGTDHTSGSGNFMIVNGATTAGVPVWSQTVNNILPNTTYYFSTWISGLNNNNNVADLKFTINGTQIGPVISSPNTINNWIQFYTTWNSGSNTSASISIVNQNTVAGGNDFGLDDISFTTACPATRQVTITVNPYPVASAGTDQTICQGQTAELTATGAGAGGTYHWSTGETTNSISVHPSTTTTYTVTVTNAGGCSSTASVTVHINGTPPTAVCKNITVALDANGHAVITGADVDGGSTATCGLQSITVSPSEFSCESLGQNTVTLTVTDIAGNTSTCTATVTVVDNTDPVAICKSITVYLDANGHAVVSAADIDGGSYDNCGIVTRAATNCSFNCSNVGTNIVTLFVQDAAGNTSSCNATVTVVDNTPPTAICKNITVTLDANGHATITGHDIDGGSTDNCGIVTWAVSKCSFNCSDAGANEVTLFVADAAGNSASCTAVVTVVNANPPTAVCKNITVALDAHGHASITAADIDGGSTGCGSITLSASQTSFDCSNLGVNHVTLTVTDAAGHTSTCVADVTVVDNIDPVAVCKSITVYLGANGSVAISAADIDGGSYDNCGIVTRAASVCHFDCSNIGTNTVTLFVADASGNTSSCNATVTVVDNTPPTAICKNITIALDANGHASITAHDIDGGSTDNCGIVSWADTKCSFDCSNLGVNEVTLFVADAAGNSSSCVATVTVVDNTPPTITCAANKTIACNGTVSFDTPSATDNCGAHLTITVLVSDAVSGNVHTRTWQVTDGAGNSATCSQSITVLPSTLDMGLCSHTNLTNGSSSGSVSAGTVTGATGTVTYTWKNASNVTVGTTATVTGLPAGTYTLTVQDACASLTCSQTIPPIPGCDGFRTQTQGGWGASPNGGNPGAYLHANFAAAFPSGLTVGCTNKLKLTTAQAVTNFLPSGSTPRALPAGTLVDPAGTYNNVFAGQVVTLALNIGFDNYDANFGSSTTNLKDLVINSGTFAGMTVQQVFTLANNALGGCAGSSPYTISQLNDAVDNINQNYDDGKITGNYLTCCGTMTMSACSHTDATCASSNGSVTAGTVTNANGTVTYVWKNASNQTVGTTATVTGLPAGTYTLTVSDRCGSVTCSQCVASTSSGVSCSIASIPVTTGCNGQTTGAPSTTLYLGYGPQSTKLSVTAYGAGPFTYSWTGPVSIPTSSAPVFTPTSGGTYTFEVTVTNCNGCTSTCSITICVLDIRVPARCGTGYQSGQVYMCGVPSCGGSPQTMVVDDINVPYYLNHGATLGSCGQVCGTAKDNEVEEPALLAAQPGFEVAMYPNPFESQFHLKVSSESKAPVEVKVFDMSGKLIHVEYGLGNNDDIMMGEQLAVGVYFVQVQQGETQKVIRMVKQE